jgi:hypothetical protein
MSRTEHYMDWILGETGMDKPTVAPPVTPEPPTTPPTVQNPIGAQMSSSYENDAFPAENCINGDKQSYGGMCHTEVETAPWLALDFGEQVVVKSVTIYNRNDGCTCADRFRNAEVRVTDMLPTDGTEMFTGGQLLGDFTGPGTIGQVIPFQGEKYLRGRYPRA